MYCNDTRNYKETRLFLHGCEDVDKMKHRTIKYVWRYQCFYFIEIHVPETDEAALNGLGGCTGE